MWLWLCFIAGAQEPVQEGSPPVSESRTDAVVRVVVRGGDNKPLPTAVIRHPKEMDRHRVNSVDGSWEASVLYLPDGTELHFTPGLDLELEISAPGFMTQVLRYEVRRRRNVVEVTLPAIALEDRPIEEPAIGFGRDEPREPGAER